MKKQRVSSFPDLDLSKVKPATSAPKSDKAALTLVAEENGFTTRHAPRPHIITRTGQIDGRSLRRSNKTNRLTLAVSPEVDRHFEGLPLS